MASAESDYEDVNPFWYGPIPRQCQDVACAESATHRVYWGKLGYMDYCASHADLRVSRANEYARRARGIE